MLKIEANFYAVTEWTPLATDAAKKEVVKRRRHANVSKSGFISSMKDESKVNQRDVLIDEGKQADIEALGDCLRALADGEVLGDMSLTIVLYDRDRATVEHEVSDFAGIFTNQDGLLFPETYNQLNALFALIPGNYARTSARCTCCSPTTPISRFSSQCCRARNAITISAPSTLRY